MAPYLVVWPVHGQSQPAEQGDVPVYVTRQDCHQLVAHHPAPDVNYQPGVDVHGRPVAPADLPGSQNLKILPDRVTFDLKVNPLAYGSRLSTSAGDKFANTAMPIARIEVDLLSGAVKVNGQPLDSEQTRIVTDACRKAGYR
jgi:hypothetical protein